MEYSSADMYEDVPAVVFQSGMVCTAGGYESAMLYDMYLASDDILMCALDDKYSSEYDMPFDTLLLESMLDIVHWLRFHSFPVSYTHLHFFFSFLLARKFNLLPVKIRPQKQGNEQQS